VQLVRLGNKSKRAIVYTHLPDTREFTTQTVEL